MNDICMYSGLPYTCSLCPEDLAPCYYMDYLRQQKRIWFLDLRRVWVCNDNDLLTLPRIYNYGYKVI